MELIPGLTNDLARECLIRVPFGSFRSISTVNKSWNTELHSQHFHRHRRLSGLTRPHIVLALVAWPGSDPEPPSHWLIAFDPESESWTRIPHAPRLPFGYREFCRIVGVGPYIVVVTGGMICYGKITNVVHVFDLLTGQWRMGSQMPGPGRVKFGLAGDPVSQMVLVAGGESQRYGKQMKSSLLYNVAKDTWVRLADMEKERSECDAMFFDGRFHVINVIGSDETCSSLCVEILDPDTWQWGPGDEGVLGTPTSGIYYHRYWVTWKEEGDVYSARPRFRAKMKVRRGGGRKWRAVAHVAAELMKISCLMTWKGKLVVIGGPFSSKVMQHDAYVRDLKSYEWRKISLPQEVSSFADIVSCCGMDL